MIKRIVVFILCSITIFNCYADLNKSVKRLKDYSKVITKDTKTYKGFITVHFVKDKLYFEIPKNIMGRDFLLASRVSQLSNNNKIAAGQMYTNPIMLRFGLEEDKVFVYKPSTDMLTLSTESVDLKCSLERNFMTPIWAIYNIEAVNPKTSAVIIDVTKFFEKEIEELTPFSGRNKPGTLNSKGGKFVSIKAFSNNVEIKNRFVYKGKTPFVSIMHRSLVLLSEQPMKKRLADSRVGYLASSKFQIVSNYKGSEREVFIHRWRLEPKFEDIEKYNRGELVEPQKPIIYYVDNALPNKWRKYVKAGIEDWQIAFEAIGFKNAIVAKDYPKNNPNFDPEDLKNSCFRYVASATANAMGPSWIDPRSGEIIQGDVIWYHSVINRLYTWRFVQTAAVDERIRELTPSDDLLGDAIRYAAAHEIGHTLGLSHNFGASYSYPVDSLRSVSFTHKYGTTPSIMDYARFNYVAQRGDKGVKLTPPLLGEYDKFAIKYGYKPIYNIDNYKDEYSVLNSWILSNKDNSMIKFGEQGMFGSVPDPAAQAEDLGDDAIKAGEYGINNLKYISKHFVDWLREKDKGYGRILEINSEIEKQFERYINRVIHFIGGVYKSDKVQGQSGVSNIVVPVNKQEECLTFIFKELRQQPQWIMNDELTDRIGSNESDIFKFQTGVLSKLLDVKLFGRLLDSEKISTLSNINYTLNKYLEDLNFEIWKPTISGKSISKYEKNIQAQYIHILLNYIRVSTKTKEKKNFGISDKGIKSVELFSTPLINKSLLKCKKIVRRLIKMAKNDDKYHYMYLYKMIISVDL